MRNAVTLMDCDHTVQQKVDVLETCTPKPTQIVVSCDLEFY